MEKRHENAREGGSQKSNNNTGNNPSNRNNHTKRNKRRGGNKKGNSSNSGVAQTGNGNLNGIESQQHTNAKKSFLSGGSVSSQPDYGNVFWQQQPQISQQQLLTPNGQRLFTAVSDPTVCGYSPMPLTYAMEPVSLPPMYQIYQQVPRPSYRNYRGRARRNPQVSGASRHAGMKTMGNQINGYSSLQENNFNYSTSTGYQNGDYASLPPAANIENGAAAEELNSEHRRYSDPGLGPPQIPTTLRSDDSESIESGSSVTTVGRSSKLILSLIEQVTALKESNSQLFKELHQTKSELQTVKLELNRLKQSNFADYQPGMLSDIVREMREAAKVREESLILKVKSMMSEKQPKAISVNGSETELDELKRELARITDEKAETETRLVKVEHELATLKSNANHEGQEIVALEEETLALRRELQEARASRNLAENHAAKLEKLMEILRKKMNGASAEETVADIQGLVASGVKGSALATSSPNIKGETFSISNNPTRSSNASMSSSSSDDSDSRSNSTSCTPGFRVNSIDNGSSTSTLSLSGNSTAGLSGPVTDL